MIGANGAVQTYMLSASTGTVRYDAVNKAMVIQVHLLGYLQTGATQAQTVTDLGTYTGTAPVDTANVRFAGSLDSADHASLFSHSLALFSAESRLVRLSKFSLPTPKPAIGSWR